MAFQPYTNQNSCDSDFNEDSRTVYDSEEDTDDASETEFRGNQNYATTNSTNGNNNELKEQMYQLKMAALQRQMEELKQYIHPEYMKRVRKLEIQYKERLKLNDIQRDYSTDCVEKDYILEKKAALKEYEEKKVELKDIILSDFEERRKVIENERYNLELTNDSTEIKPTITRKLRRRPNEPVPVVEKRRKPTTGQLIVYTLDDKEIENDIKQIQRGLQNGTGSYNSNHHQNALLVESVNNFVETRIEDGKLLYERRWFHRGQQVFVEGKDMAKFPATITAIGNEVVWVKKVNDSKVKISMSHLAKGKIIIKRRAN